MSRSPRSSPGSATPTRSGIARTSWPTSCVNPPWCASSTRSRWRRSRASDTSLATARGSPSPLSITRWTSSRPCWAPSASSGRWRTPASPAWRPRASTGCSPRSRRSWTTRFSVTWKVTSGDCSGAVACSSARRSGRATGARTTCSDGGFASAPGANGSGFPNPAPTSTSSRPGTRRAPIPWASFGVAGSPSPQTHSPGPPITS